MTINEKNVMTQNNNIVLITSDPFLRLHYSTCKVSAIDFEKVALVTYVESSVFYELPKCLISCIRYFIACTITSFQIYEMQPMPNCSFGVNLMCVCR